MKDIFDKHLSDGCLYMFLITTKTENFVNNDFCCRKVLHIRQAICQCTSRKRRKMLIAGLLPEKIAFTNRWFQANFQNFFDIFQNVFGPSFLFDISEHLLIVFLLLNDFLLCFEVLPRQTIGSIALQLASSLKNIHLERRGAGTTNVQQICQSEFLFVGKNEL